MKKYLSIVMLVAAMMCAQKAVAQLQFGAKGGLNVSKIKFNKDIFDSSNRTGWFIGPTVKYTLPILGLSFDAAALYDQRSSKVSDAKAALGETTVKQQQIIVPVNARLGFGASSVANVFVFAGPQFGFNVGDDEFSWKSKSDVQNVFQLRKSSLSVNVGAGVTLFGHLQVAANYNIAAGKTGDAKVKEVANDAYKTITDGKANAFQLSMAYYF